MRKETVTIVLLLLFLFTGLLVSCGGGGGGNSAPQLSPPAFNLTGTWDMEETVTGGTCVGAPPSISWDAVVVQASGSNTVNVTDTRSLAGPAAAMTLSGTSLTYSGQRYNEDQADCDSMTASYVVTMATATSFSNGSGTLTCSWTDPPAGSCTVTTRIAGQKRP